MKQTIFYIEDCCLYKDEKNKLCDFVPKVTDVIRFINGFPSRYKIKFYIKQEDGSEQVIHYKWYSLSEIENCCFSETDDRLVLYRYPKAIQDFVFYIRKQAQTAKVHEKFYVDHIGDFVFENKHYYCMGNVILPDNAENRRKFYISRDVKNKFRLDIDTSISEPEAWKSAMDFFNIREKQTDIMTVYSCMGLMRSFFRTTNSIPCFSLMIAGDSQTGKTTASEYISSLYNRSKGLKNGTVRTDSSKNYVERMLTDFHDVCIIYDDINRDPVNKRKIEERVSGILREIADFTGRHTMQNDVALNAQPIFTCEYIMQNFSDIGRVLLVIVNKPIDSQQLSRCQKQSLAIPAFYKNFISWLYRNFDRERKCLEEDFNKFRESDVSFTEYRRLNDVVFFMNKTYSLVLKYAVDRKIIGAEEAFRKMESFNQVIQNCVRTQAEELNKIKANTFRQNIDIAQALNILLTEKKILIGSKDCFIKKHDNNDYLYIRADTLTSEINWYYGKAKTKREIIKYFSEKGLLYTYSDGNLVKDANNKRYLAINKNRLNILINSDDFKLDYLKY